MESSANRRSRVPRTIGHIGQDADGRDNWRAWARGMSWPENGLRHFRRTEFDRPDELDSRLLLLLDEIRELAGVPIKVTSDARTEEEHERIYPDPADRPNSPHLRGTALDFKPMPDTSENRLLVLAAIMELYTEGAIENLGLEIATRHFHLDVDHELRRPHLWVGVSR